MKKTVLLMILGFMLSGLSMHVRAQGYFNRAQEGEIKFGIRGGVNYFNMGTFVIDADGEYGLIDFFDDVKFKTKHRIGFQIGGYADIWMSPVFSFMPEINFIRKGAKLDETVTIDFSDPDDPDSPFQGSMEISGNLNTELYYAEVPLLLGVKPVPSLTLFAGPQVSYLVFQKLTSYNEDGTEDDELVGREGLEKLLVGGAAGARFDLTPNINISARYTTDFQSAFKKDHLQKKMRNAGVAFSIGYTF